MIETELERMPTFIDYQKLFKVPLLLKFCFTEENMLFSTTTQK